MAAITYDRATLVYPGATRPVGRRARPGDRRRRVPRPRRPVGLRQVHLAADARRARGGRPTASIRIGDRDVTHLAAQGPRHRDGVPELRAVPAHDGGRQHGLRAQDRRHAQGGDAASGSREAAGLLDLEQYLDRKPKALSGGQRQRVAMGRAIVRQPQVFLMDEPLSNLDAKLRVQTRTEIAALQRRLGTTTVYVTHDQVEAMTMGDRVAVLKDGVLQQVDTPRNLYDRPANEFVAGFIGSPAMNLVPVPLTEGGAVLGGHSGAAAPLGARRRSPRRAAARRRWASGPRRSSSSAPGEGFPVEVQVVEELGSDAFAYGRLQAEAASRRRGPAAGPAGRRPQATGEGRGRARGHPPRRGARLLRADRAADLGWRQLSRGLVAGRPRPPAPRVLG